MKSLTEFDTAYRDWIVDGCTKAIVEIAHDPASKMLIMRNGEICDALVEMLAGFMATSQETDSASNTRRLVDSIAKQLTKRIGVNRENILANGWPANVSEFTGYQ